MHAARRHLTSQLIAGSLVLAGVACWAPAASAARAAGRAEPDAPAIRGSQVVEVSADSSSDVWAAAYVSRPGGTHDVMLHWDGSVWSEVALPKALTHMAVRSIDALSPTDVWAVGSLDQEGGSLLEATAAIHWDGTAWRRAVTPNGGHSVESYLRSVDAVAGDDVWAVGQMEKERSGGGDRVLPLCLHFGSDGVWKNARCPHFGQGIAVSLDAVTDTPEGHLVVGGGIAHGNDEERTVIESQTDGGWSRQQTPHADEIFGLAAVSGSDIWAIGKDPNDDPATLLHLDGTQWSHVNSPQLFEAEALSVDASNDGWVVGTYGLAVHWDGAEWSNVAIRNHPDLWAVTAISPQDAWAVGQTDHETLDHQACVFHWDGTSWTKVALPPL